ncbi:MAG: hypothetical protein LBD37_10260 [Treponema sp.]|jgi:hypothetical protein|nr:hypothetical protein [Treponema sp.]
MKNAKKLFVLTAMLAAALALAGCDQPTEWDEGGNNNNNNNNSIDKFVGTWTADIDGHPLELEITSTHYNITLEGESKPGNCYPLSANEVSLTGFGRGVLLSSNSLSVTVNDPSMGDYNGRSITLTKSGSPGPGNTNAKLTVKNESVVELTEVKWSGVSFGTIVKGGNSVTKDVSAGTGYLTFKANGISLRRNEVVTVAEGETITITILDNTVVADASDTSKTGPLSTMGVPDTTLKIKNDSFVDLAEVTWNGVSFGTIAKGGNSETKKVDAGTGYLNFKANGISLRTQNTITVDAKKETSFTIEDRTNVVDANDTSKTGPLSTMGVPATTLKIKNESSLELTHVVWEGVSFASSASENSIKAGANVTGEVSHGNGYIYFRRKSNPLIARTSDRVTVQQGEGKEFIFTNETDVVEINNEDNAGTLGGLQSTVVFFDDAEGDMQQYHAKQTFVGYYNMNTPLDNGYSASYGYNNISAVKDGQKSIAVGGTNTAKLHLRVDLAGPAKLAFWVANKRSTSSYAPDDTKFSINGVVQETWTTSMDWSYKTFNLTAGQNDIVWEKTDGYYSYDGYYLSLDDVLIYYTD